VNGELETYTSSTANVQLSGGGTLQLVPLKDSSVSGGWTSGRVESKYIFTPSAGKVTIAEAKIRFGSNPTSNKQGIWPAFWILGNSIRSGTAWPECGELDILEAIDGKLTGYGTAHCDVNPGGICNEPNGLGGSITIPDQSWHTWRMAWDRTPSNWQSETITWYMDGKQFHQITGSQIGNSGIWATLCHDPLYFILNVAVGGYWVSPETLLIFHLPEYSHPKCSDDERADVIFL
jgi:beta-glucanase (GH16 family)